MECENCGLIPEQHSIDGKCPFCGHTHDKIVHVPVVAIPTQERALELRDLYTWLGGEIVHRPLGEGWESLENYLYHLSKENAEKYDEIANRD